MPVAVPLIAAAAASAATSALVTAGLSTLAASVAGAVVAGGINVVGSRALAKKPKAQAFTAEASGRTVTVRSSVESHKVVYGTAKVSGPLALAQTADSGAGGVASGPNRFLHLVIPLAGHEVAEIGDVYFNDRVVPLDAAGYATGSPYARSTTTSSQQAVTRAVVGLSAGGEGVTVTTDGPHGFASNTDVRLSGVPAPNGLLNANSYRVTRTGPTSFVLNVLPGALPGSPRGPLPVGPATAATGAATVTTTATSSYARVRKFLGTADQAADPDMVAEIPGWTAAHRLRGVAYLHVRLEYSPDVFPLGIPNVSAVVRGKLVFDPRTGLTQWSDNAALCVRDYLASDYGFRCDPAEIDDAYDAAAANVSDEPVALSTGGTQPRYRCDGVLDTAAAPLDNLQALVTSLAGAVTYVQGRFRVHAAAYDSPAGDIGVDQLAGPVTVDARPSRKELFNAVKGTYVDPLRSAQPTDFPPVTNGMYEAQDGGERIAKDVELPFTTHPEAAQRIAKIVLEKGRQGVRVTVPVNHSALKYAAWDVVTLTNPQLGWAAKPFRVLRWNLGVHGPITVSLQEESAASYAWAAGEAGRVDAAPDTDLPSPFAAAPPGALTVTEAKYVTRGGDGVKVMARLSWVPSADPFLREYRPEYRPADGPWTDLTPTRNAFLDIEDVAPGPYDFRVKAVTGLGVSSEYSATSKVINGLLDPPQEPQNLTVSTIGGLAVLRWDEYLGEASLDVRIGGKTVFRHSPDVTAGWAQSTTIGDAVAGSAAQAVLPLKPGVYLAKAVDSSRVESTLFASVTTAQATALAFADVTTLTEHPAFSGTKTDCVATGGVLSLDANGEFDTIPDLDAVLDVDGYGGVRPLGTYLFSGGIDLGAVEPVRLTSHVLAEVTNQLDKVDDRTALIDDWAMFDGDVSASADARVFVRETPDDPSVSPAWGEWRRLDSGEFSARAFQFQCELTSLDPAFNVLVRELSVTASQVA